MYPEKPIEGTERNTNTSRSRMLDRLKRKVIPVLPSPWRMLQSVPDIYRNGQTN